MILNVYYYSLHSTHDYKLIPPTKYASQCFSQQHHRAYLFQCLSISMFVCVLGSATFAPLARVQLTVSAQFDSSGKRSE